MDSNLKFDFTTTQKIINKIGYIDSFKGKWKTIEKHENKYLKELRRIATIQSIGSSTRIEGATLTNQEVETLLNNLKITKLESREEQEVVGYFEVLEIILNDWKSIDLNHSNIFNLHNLLLKFSNKDQNHRGQYKQVANKILLAEVAAAISTDPMETEGEPPTIWRDWIGDTKMSYPVSPKYNVELPSRSEQIL